MLGKRCFPIARRPLKASVILFLCIFCWGFAFGTAAQAAEVVTDTTEYEIGDTTYIDGFTFWSDEIVTLKITQLDGTPLDGEASNPWDVASNSLGDFETDWIVPYDNVVETLLVTATGQESGETATTTFLCPKVSFHQLQNGTVTSSPAWSNGNINSSNSCYSEGESVPYRWLVKSSDGGTDHYFTIQMEWTKGGIHALDYLTNYDATEDSAINLTGGPCGTIAASPPPGCSAPTDSFLLPDPTDSNNYSGAIPPDFFTKVNPGFVLDGPRYLKAYNAVIDSVGKYYFTGTASNRELNMEVYFTTDTTGSVGVFWGGHLAEGNDGAWGLGNGSASVSGAPYHMRTKNLDGGGASNKDRSIQNGVICLPPDASIVCDSDTLCADTDFTYVCRDTSDANTWTWTVVNGTIVGSNTLDSVVFYVNSGLGAGDSVIVIVEACDSAGGCPGDFCCGEDTLVLPVIPPPEATCPASDTFFVCSLDTTICVDGFSCDNAYSSTVTVNGTPGTLNGGTVCFTPVEGNNTITLICISACGADTCETVIHVDTNSPPVATCPDDDTMFVCDLSDICLDGFSCDDPDGNVVSSTINGSPFGGGQYCFTPVEGDNILTLICTDTCSVADTCQTTIYVTLNSPPVATCPDDDTLFVCDLSDICIDGFACDDPDGNVVSSTINGSPFGGGQYCFTPVEGDNILTLICTDTCGVADTCQTVIHVDLNSPPVATCPDDDTLFVCDLSDICLDGFSCDDPDNNFDYSTINGSPFGGGQYCFTPVEGDNVLTLICTDTCGAADTCQTVIHVDLNSPPVVTCPDDDTLFLCELSIICIDDFACYDPDYNAVSSTINGSPFGGGQYCFTPVEGDNVLTLICTDTCGVADTCQTVIHVDLNSPPVASCPLPDTVFVCSLNTSICVDGFSCDDPDNNFDYSTINGSPFGGGQYCFTPVLGMNQLVLECVDSCATVDVCTTFVYVEVNSPPTAYCPAADTLFVCSLNTTICISGFSCDDPDGNYDTSTVTVNGAPVALQGDSVCFMPQQGDNSIIFACIDSCGAVDQCTTIVHVDLNNPPEVTCADDDTLFMCDLSEICIPPFYCSDPDGNLASCEVSPGTLDSEAVCFTPVEGANTITLIATDSCGEAHTCQTNIYVVLNSPPEASCPLPDTVFVCSLNTTICVDGFSCDDPDNNFSYSTINGSPFGGGQYCFTPVAGVNTLTLICVDSCDAADTCETFVYVELNSPPVTTCPDDDTLFVCDLSEICISGFSCYDPDGNLASCEASPGTLSGGTVCFTPVEGTNTITLTATDSCGISAQCTVNVDVEIVPCGECPNIVIEKTHKTIQGTHEFVNVTVDSGTVEMGGFDILIAYDRSALNFQRVIKGPLFDTCYVGCGWEYFTYRTWFFPSYYPHFFWGGVVRIVGMAELNNGAHHPCCFVLPAPFVLFTLDFLVTDNRQFECQYVGIRFYWTDCGDNVISSVTGDTLWVSDHVWEHPFDTLLPPYDIADDTVGFPTYFGFQVECFDSVWSYDPWTGDSTLKPLPTSCIDFFNGGIDIACADSIDDRGDINLNGIAYEIADAVVFTNYFIYGFNAFNVNVDGQTAATDVNADGLALTVGDLVYQIRVIVGDAMPYPKLAPVEANYVVDKGVISVDAEMGAALVVVEGDVTPTLLADNMDIKYAYNAEENVTRVLVYSFEGNGFSGEFLNANGNVISIELGSYEGAVVKTTEIPANFALNQNYPNPFNPVTTISFNLPVASEYTLTVYNVTGQVVTQFAGEAEAGVVSLEWDASDMASGVYFYRLHAGEFTATKKMLLLK